MKALADNSITLWLPGLLLGFVKTQLLLHIGTVLFALYRFLGSLLQRSVLSCRKKEQETF